MSTQVISIVEANEIREMALSTLLSGKVSRLPIPH